MSIIDEKVEKAPRLCPSVTTRPKRPIIVFIGDDEAKKVSNLCPSVMRRLKRPPDCVHQ